MNREDALLTLRIVVGVHLAFAVLGVALALLMAFGFTLIAEMPEHASVLFAVVLTFILLFLAFSIIVLIGLLRMRPWSRIPGMVLGAISLLSFPLGTIIGALEIWLLAFNADVKRAFADTPNGGRKGRAKRPPRSRRA